jgi:hypothetical protein
LIEIRHAPLRFALHFSVPYSLVNYDSDAQGHPHQHFSVQSMRGAMLFLESRYAAEHWAVNGRAGFGVQQYKLGEQNEHEIFTRQLWALGAGYRFIAQHMDASLGLAVVGRSRQLIVAASQRYLTSAAHLGFGPDLEWSRQLSSTLQMAARGIFGIAAFREWPGSSAQYQENVSQGRIPPLRESLRTRSAAAHGGQTEIMELRSHEWSPALLVSLDLALIQQIREELYFSIGTVLLLDHAWLYGPGFRTINAYERANESSFEILLRIGIAWQSFIS